MASGKSEVKCPFCGYEGVSAFIKPSYLQAKTTRISRGGKTTYHRVPESIEYQGKCPKCGKTAKEMQKAQNTGITKQMTHEERLKRIKEAGLPMVIEG